VFGTGALEAGGPGDIVSLLCLVRKMRKKVVEVSQKSYVMKSSIHAIKHAVSTA